ncbi:MAG: DUF2254 domain-containing protein [Akkermansiaceae bacterium]
MKIRLVKIRDSLADSFWFVPTAMALGAIIAALVLVEVDGGSGVRWLRDFDWFWSGGPDGARAMMATIAGSLITVVSIVFSLTITTLSQTATHFGPRVLRNFTSDRGVQITLGTFLSTFVYCLLVMRTVRSADESDFVPYVAVNLGFLMTLASLAVLIYFIDHVAKSIQAENLIAVVGEDFLASLPVLFPKQIGAAHDPKEDRAPSVEKWKRAEKILTREAGYLQRIDDAQLLRLAAEHDLIVRLIRRPGEFLAPGATVMEYLPDRTSSGSLREQLGGTFAIGRHRTPHQDGLYPAQQLVEIAAHALSPGINEPFTALTCIDWLGACLRGVALSDEPAALRRDKDHRLRVIANPLIFGQVVEVAFDQIRICGGSNPDVVARLFQTIQSLAPDLRRRNDCQVLIRQIRIIGGEIGRISNKSDRDRVTEQQQQALHALAESQPLDN